MKLIFRNFLCLSVIVFTVAACYAPKKPNSQRDTDTARVLRPLLNSERIKLKFGSYGIDVLKSTEKVRVSDLYSGESSQKVTRTFAVVLYPEIISNKFSQEHQLILSGESIGAVFKANHWQIDKKHLYFGSLKEHGDNSSLYQLLGDIDPVDMAIHIYTLFVSKDNVLFRYATIVEVHHPKYLKLEELAEIYDEEFKQYRSVDSGVSEILKLMRKEISLL